MKLKEQNILFFSRSTQHGGAENVVLQLCEIFNPLVNKIVICSANGFKTNEVKKFNIKHYIIPDIEKKDIKNMKLILKELKRIIKFEEITIIHTPVSYTHLDVYKRQVWYLSSVIQS